MAVNKSAGLKAGFPEGPAFAEDHFTEHLLRCRVVFENKSVDPYCI